MNVLFRNKPIEMLTRDEAVEALRQALSRVAELEGLPTNFNGYPFVVSSSIPTGTLIATFNGKEVGRIES